MLRSLLRSAFKRSGARRLNEEGARLWAAGRLAEAEAAFRSATEGGGFAPACSNLGMVLFEQGRFAEALQWLNRAIELDPSHAGAHLNLAMALHQMERIESAAEHFSEALRLAPDDPLIQSNTLRPLMDVCDWDAVEERVAQLKEWAGSSKDDWADRVSPFTSLLLPLEEHTQLRIARRHARAVREKAALLRRPEARGHSGSRLRVGYVSSDFHDHATAFLCAGVFEAHDRERLEIFAYSLGRDDGGKYRRRIAAGCEHFSDVAGLSAGAIAERIAGDGIDIAVDMKGYTGGARPEIFAVRAAPVQVAWLGYPGTTGAAFIDYIVADAHTIPAGHEPYYEERVIRLPGSYQPNDGGSVPEAAVSREAAGLPPEGFVFCCFNQHFKLDRATFACWMRMLAAVPNSILWLMSGNRLSEGRLREEARCAGVDPERLVFAPFLPRGSHLARTRLADLFLDTHPVNAHTTASDALRAGVPLLTRTGTTFASRVGVSLSNAAQLPELVARSSEEYESLAIALARSPERLADLRARLEGPGRRSPLFDTVSYTRRLERAFEAIWRRHASGAHAESFDLDSFDLH